MDHYHVWCNLKDTRKDLEFSGHVARYLDELKRRSLLRAWSLSRRKLGFGPRELGEFHMVLSVDGLAQLDEAFRPIAARTGPVEDLHRAVYSMVTDFTSALYRDFPDPERVAAGAKT